MASQTGIAVLYVALTCTPPLRRRHRCSGVMDRPQKVWAPSPPCEEVIRTFLWALGLLRYRRASWPPISATICGDASTPPLPGVKVSGGSLQS